MQSCVQTHQILLASFEIFHSTMCKSSRHLHIPHTHHTWHLNQGCHHNQCSTSIEIQALVSKAAMQHTVYTAYNTTVRMENQRSTFLLCCSNFSSWIVMKCASIQASKYVYVRMNTHAYVYRNDNRMHRQSYITQISAWGWPAATNELLVLLCFKTCSCRVSPKSNHVSLPV